MHKLTFASDSDAVQDHYAPTRSEKRPLIQSDTILTLREMLDKGGPDPADYPLLDQLMQQLYRLQQNGHIGKTETEFLQSSFGEDFLANTIHGYVYRKPLGYAGDFALIDMIYNDYSFEHADYQKWDRYFHAQPAVEAVRNRKAFFKQKMLEKLNGRTSVLNLLNVASGPVRDLFELYEQIDPKMLKATCVDIDSRAISFAADLCRPYEDQISFRQKNILRFYSEEKYDVIWSAGLFDYFEDRIFILAIKRLLTFLKPGGEILIGNFSENNPSRGYMEIFGEWFLIHRTAEELRRLSIEAGVHPANISVEQEPLGINLFLKIRSSIPAGQSALCMN